MTNSNPTIIWDLCQTLFDTTHRLPHILNEPKDWPAFDALTLDDTIIEPAKMVYMALNGAGYTQIIITGRNERVREANQQLLALNGVFYDRLYMRPVLNRERSAPLKKMLLDKARADGFNPVLAFEDEPESILMYRTNGVMVFAADDKHWRAGSFKHVDPD